MSKNSTKSCIDSALSVEQNNTSHTNTSKKIKSSKDIQSTLNSTQNIYNGLLDNNVANECNGSGSDSVSGSGSGNDSVSCNNSTILDKKLVDNFDVYIKGTKNITGRQTLLIIPILKFFNQYQNLIKLIPILDGTSPISLRLIDWFVTNYCKKFNTMYNVQLYENRMNNDKNKKIVDNFDNYFIVHSNYKGQLKTCNKKNFDPFCRRNRIQFYYEPKRYFETTVGQLNFFKWAIENFIVDYIGDNIVSIEEDMNQNSKINESTGKKKKTQLNSNTYGATQTGQASTNTLNNETSNDNSTNDNTKKKKKKKSKKNSTRKKRKELSTSASRTMFKHNYPTVISFD